MTKHLVHACALAVLLGGCDQLIAVHDAPSSGSIPAAVQERFTIYCATPACHGGTQAPDLRAGNAATILDRASTTGMPYVDLGNPQGSYLAVKLLPEPSAGTTMPPPGSPPLPAEDEAIILGWIAGAMFPDEGTSGATLADGSDTMSSADATTSDGDAGGDTMSTTNASSTTGTSDTDGGVAPVCSLERVQPGAASPVDAGTGAGQIPIAIGEVLDHNCGCHYATTAMSPYTALLGVGYQPMETLADFTGAYAGINMAAYGSGTGADAVYDRVVTLGTMPQTIVCDVGGGAVITDEDFATLRAWLEAGTPDGASG